MKTYIGIDPGLHGAIAALTYHDDDKRDLEIFDMPIHALLRGGKNKNEIDHYELARIFDELSKRNVMQIVVERVSSMPGQGVSSVFSFGKAYGHVLQAAAALYAPLETIPPSKWKAALDVPASKDGARARASALLPQFSHNWTRVKDDGRAEAALLARHARYIWKRSRQ